MFRGQRDANMWYFPSSALMTEPHQTQYPSMQNPPKRGTGPIAGNAVAAGTDMCASARRIGTQSATKSSSAIAARSRFWGRGVDVVMDGPSRSLRGVYLRSEDVQTYVISDSLGRPTHPRAPLRCAPGRSAAESEDSSDCDIRLSRATPSAPHPDVIDVRTREKSPRSKSLRRMSR